MSTAVAIADLQVGEGCPLVIIAGPCLLQSSDFNLRHAERLLALSSARGFELIFKASFDKANRTRGDSARGPGLDEGLRLLEEVKTKLGLRTLTDVHLPEQCAPVAEVVDVLQIPAFLCRQTDLLAAAGATGRVVNIKKGQFLAAADMAFARDKTGAADRVLLTERGTSFGYRDLVVDFRNLGIMRQLAPVVFDGTHSVQSPGSETGITGGNRNLVPPLVRAAVACGVDALFAEVHPYPDQAPSDAANQLNYDLFEQVLDDAQRVRRAV